MDYTATYSPEDDKLRLYAATRLPQDIYDRIKAAGFQFPGTWMELPDDTFADEGTNVRVAMLTINA